MKTFLKYLILLLIISSVSLSTIANTEIDDCMISGLKGVSSDAASRMIKQSCENKITSKNTQKNIDEYGGDIDEELESINWNYDDNKNIKMIFKNTSRFTSTFIKINVSKPNKDGSCPHPSEEDNKYFYRLTVKPMSEAAFVAPVSNLINKTNNSLCLKAVALLGRDPRWNDYQLGAARPLETSSLEKINLILNKNFSNIPRVFPNLPPPQLAAPKPNK